MPARTAENMVPNASAQKQRRLKTETDEDLESVDLQAAITWTQVLLRTSAAIDVKTKKAEVMVADVSIKVCLRKNAIDTIVNSSKLELLLDFAA